MKKQQMSAIWTNDLVPQLRPIKRERVAYLLRAARSRRFNEIRHVGNGYAIGNSLRLLRCAAFATKEAR